ncbi:DUF1501 domain-containing protein [Xylophilus sp.]|uniref:DUF1501 domain-containing protein n=1 Tax=Xylophilus sp. TaxID=2653893 RepID=UPI0013BD6506|nr:DUF1501 domain-containing protein [Xylophilus sp.]KAF1045744.1 MAG: hypothetical protein GAK38_02880 [Xylophilus sp.]
MTLLDRRQWLQLAAAGAFAATAPSVFAQAQIAPGAGDARFLLVFLRGAYDATNVLVPTGSDFYYESRPTIAIARPPAAGAPENPQAVLALHGADGWGLHPALGPSVLPLWQARQLAFIPFAGTDDLSRSHFETQDSVEAGLPLPGEGSGPPAALRGSGFLNRLARVLDARGQPVAFTDGVPAAFAGPVNVPNVSLKGTARAPFDARQTGLLAQMYQGTRYAPLIAEGFELRRTVAEQAAAQQKQASAQAAGMAPDAATRRQEMEAASRQAISARGFELEARRMAGLLKERYNLGFIDVGGWDTHVNQGGAQGQLASLLDNLGRGLAGFAQEMGPAWDRTVVVVVSEFGRTFRENGTRGTDHGHGSVYWVAGGAVRGGRLAGEQVAVGPATLNQNRDWPVKNEYRAVLGGVFQRIYGLDRARLAQVFPDVAPRDIGLV